jgi:hypothetical protein
VEIPYHYRVDAMVRLVYKTVVGVVLNTIVIVTLSVFVSVAKKKFFITFGPRDDLLFMNAVINTWAKYILLLTITSAMNIIHVIVGDYSFPIIIFTVYSHETTVIYGFSRAQLQACATLLSVTAGLTHIFSINAIMSGVDVAFVSYIPGEITAFVISYFLIKNKKKFIKNYDSEDELNAVMGEPLVRTQKLSVVTISQNNRQHEFRGIDGNHD